MRTGILVVGLALCIGVYQGWHASENARVNPAALTPEARLAIDARCGGKDDRAARECRRLLKRLYVARSLDPDKTLRTYCDAVKNARWGGSRPAPPKVCAERYGGWESS